MPAVSVIIPIYNVEAYLAQCLESIIYQTHKNLEIICIDDGSTDNSAIVCEKYAAIDSRIKFIRQANAGPSAARNVGLDVATGDYVHFMDSDDYIDLDFYEKMLTAAVETNSDMSVGGVVSQMGERYAISYNTKLLLVSIEEKFKITNALRVAIMVKYLFKREFLLKINFRFVKGRIFEDMLGLPEVIVAANRIVTVPNTNYYYVKNPKSLLNAEYTEDHDEQYRYADNFRSAFIEKYNLKHLPRSYVDTTVYVYKFLFFKLLTKRISGDTVRWSLFGMRILKINKRAEA